MHRFKIGFVVLLGVCLFAVPAFAAISLSVDGVKKGIYENVDLPPGYEVTQDGTKGVISLGVEDVTTSAADPGVGAASITEVITRVTTNPAGSAADYVTLADGTIAGQLKIIINAGGIETSGLSIQPTNLKGATSDIILYATGDTAMFVFDGTYWDLLSTTGTRR